MSAVFSFLEGVAMAMLAIAWFFAVFNIRRLPSKIPVHFNIEGKADVWASKYFIFLLPVLGSLIYYLFFFPEGFNYYPVKITPENQEFQLNIGKMAAKSLITYLLFIFVFIEKNIISIALNKLPGKRLKLLPVIGGIFALTIFFIILSQVYR